MARYGSGLGNAQGGFDTHSLRKLNDLRHTPSAQIQHRLNKTG
jgi:hypothetical protein